MRRMRFLVLAVSVFAVLGFSVVAANAAWYTCNVNYVGPGGSTVYIQLTDTAATPAFTNTFFIPAATYAKEFLATALTAKANNMTVRVNVTAIAQYSAITNLYIQ